MYRDVGGGVMARGVAYCSPFFVLKVLTNEKRGGMKVISLINTFEPKKMGARSTGAHSAAKTYWFSTVIFRPIMY
jgi:hypothetical protein